MSDAVKKTKKKKGPIRIEAIVPITIVLLLFFAYFRFFFDSHLRKGIEYGATMAHGAEVNVGSLRTSFTEPSISIFRIQVTDKKKPEMNMVEIGEIKLKLLWDALLRGKFVIPESSILKVQVQSKRRRPGRVIPPKKGKSDSGVEGVAKETAQMTLDQLAAKHDENLLADVFSIAGGTDYKDQLKKMEGELQSQQKIKELETQFKQKEQEWKKKIDDLPDESEIKQLVKKIEGLKIDTKNPAAIQRSLKEVDKVYKEARAKYKSIEGAKKAFDQDLKNYKNEYKNLEKLIQKDIDGVAKKLNIPSLDSDEINKMLLGNLVASQLGDLMQYQDMVREYMPSKSAKDRNKSESSELTPVERASGVNYRFPKNKSYPRFWLQKAQVSSDSKDGIAGDLTGTLRNVTNNPKHLGKPATFDFTGGFPKQNIMDVKGNITVDHTTENEKEFGEVSVGSFPVTENTFTQSKDVTLGYKEAKGSSKIAFQLQNQQLSVASNSIFSNVAYFVEASDKNVRRLLENVVNSLNNLDLNIRAKGSWDNLSLNINSNLGRKLSDAITQQISGEIKRARQQVENQVRGAIDQQKGKLNSEVQKLEKQLGVSLKSREDAINSVKASVDKKKNEAKNKEVKKVEKKAKKELKKLLKGIKF